MSRMRFIADEWVQRLIERKGAGLLVVRDVADGQLYGSKYKRSLSGPLAELAVTAGCEPIVYQAVHWWCLVYVPIWPLGSYVVMPEGGSEGSHEDADRYRVIRVEADQGQIAMQYAIVSMVIGCATLAVRWYVG